MRRLAASCLLAAGCAGAMSSPFTGLSDLAGAAPDLAGAPVDGPAAAGDLAAAIPDLVDVQPGELTIAAGQAFQLKALFAGRYFGTRPVDVTFTSSDPTVVNVPGLAQLQFNANEAQVTAAAVKVGEVTIQVVRGQQQKSATVRVVPAVSQLTPNPLRVEKGQVGSFTVTLSAPAPKGGATLMLQSSDPKTFAVAPPMLVLTEGKGSATFTVSALAQGGPINVTASYAGSQKGAQAFAIEPVRKLALSEVLYDALGADEGYEWVELWNGGADPVDLAGYFLAVTPTSNDPNFRSMTPALQGTLMPGDCKVVGGPTVDPMANGLVMNFVYFQAIQFNPAIPNGQAATSVGVALMKGDPKSIAQATMVDAVIYGTKSRGIADEGGGTTRLDAGYVAFPKQTIERVGPGAWRVQPTAGGGNCDWLHL